MHIPRFRALVALVLLGAAAAGCRRTRTAAELSPVEVLDRALAPSSFAAALRKLGGGHYHATALFHVESTGAGSDEAGKPASPAAITTTTDLWMDKQGGFRLSESNDQDGGREIVRVGGEVAVALRYGKLVRRPAEDAESARILAEALGAPWAVWETVRRQVAVERSGGAGYHLKLGGKLAALPANFPSSQGQEGLRKWRDSVLVKALDGQASLDAGSKVPLAFNCKTSFEAVRDGVAIAGEIAVSAALDDVGKVADIAMPEAETLHWRQRTVLEERALLGGLGTAVAAPVKKTAP